MMYLRLKLFEEYLIVFDTFIIMLNPFKALKVWIAFLWLHTASIHAFMCPSESELTTTKLSSFQEIQNSKLSRRNLFQFSIIATSIGFTIGTAPHAANSIPEQKSYSTNARNMDRLSNGDSSGGSIYENAPSSKAAAKRRAMLGCKIPASNQKALEILEKENKATSKWDEKECNLKVLGGDTEFMLKAMRELECPTCPYGIQGA